MGTAEIQWMKEAQQRIRELQEENKRLRGACKKLLNVHSPKQGDYVDAVMHMSALMQELEPESVVHSS